MSRVEALDTFEQSVFSIFNTAKQRGYTVTDTADELTSLIYLLAKRRKTMEDTAEKETDVLDMLGDSDDED